MEFDHSTDTISPDDQQVITIGSTGGFVVPVGTTGQRPGSPTLATIRWNSDTSALEVYNASSVWSSAAPQGITQLAKYKSVTNDQAATDPGAGNLKWNNATLSSSTIIYIDALTSGSFDATNYINAVNVPFILYIQDLDDASIFQRWTVTSKTNNTGWFTFNVTYIDGAGTIGNNKAIALTFANNNSGGGAVASVSGTANQVTSTPTTGAVVVSLPSTLIAPGTVQATGSFIVGTATNSITSTTGTTINITTGAAATTTSPGNDVTILSGAGGSTSGNSGNLNITAGAATNGYGGYIYIAGGLGAGTNNEGGGIDIDGGYSTNFLGGYVSVKGGVSEGTGEPGGSVTVTGGNSLTGAGGYVTVSGGIAIGTGNGGNVNIQGGYAADGVGGSVSIAAYSGAGTNKSGGNVTITAGARTGTGTAGSINLVIPATGTLKINGSAGTAGQVLTSQGAATAPTWGSAASPAYLTFTGQAASPGATTLWMDNGTNYTANTMVWDNPAVFLQEVNFGAPGFEQNSITVNGTTYDAVVKISEFDGARDATLLLHRHSDTPAISSLLAFSRSRGNTSSHSNVAADDIIGELLFTGWNTSSYYRGARILAEVDGTPGVSDMPTRIRFMTSADGSATPTEYLRISSAGAIGLSGANYGTAGQVLTSAGPSAAPTWSATGLPAAGTAGNLLQSNGSIFQSVDALAYDLKVTASVAKTIIRGTSTSQYTGSSIVLLNGATANRKGVGFGSFIRDADGTDSYFALDGLDNTDAYEKSLLRYNLGDDYWDFLTANTIRLTINPAGAVAFSLAYGTAGQVLTSAGDTGPPTWEAAGSGVTSITLTQPAAGLTITGSGTAITSTGTPTFALANDLLAVEGLAATGIVRRTAADTWSAGTAVGLTTEVTGILPGANGGTNNAFMAFTGPTTSLRTFTLPNATATILTSNAAVTAAQGGTGQTTYAIGDLLQASAATTLSKLAAVATGNVLISGGVTTVSSWGKVGLTTHVSGNLPVTNLNSGTGASGTTFWCGDGTWATPSGASPLPNATILGVTSAANSITGIAGASSAAPMTLIAGFASGGTGNDITVSGGSTASGQGGTAIITGGTAGGANDGGNLLLKAGDTSSTGLGGSITMHADSIYKGGNITIRAGNSPGNNVAGGDLSLAAGHSQNGSTSNRGGNITITAGDSITAGNPAGNITISSGITTAGTGGYLVFRTGSTVITERFRILANGAWSVGSAGTDTGTATHVLTSNGSAAAPTWQAGGTVTSVTITQPAAGITVTSSGVAITTSGTRTLALANDLAAVEGLATTGIVRRTGTDAWSAGTAVGLTTEVTGILPGANGGTNNAFMAFTGPATPLKTFTLPNATATILTSNAAVTPAQGGTGVGTTPTNGQLLVGNGTNYTVATVGTGTGISTTVGAGTLTINNTGVTSNVATTNQTTVSGATGAVTIGLSSTLVAPGSLQVTTSTQTSATNTISAAGTTQGTATVLTTDYNVVTTTASGTGVVLPAGLAGRTAKVVNRGANALLVYPASGAQIDALGANVAISVIVNGTLEVTSISATQWYVVNNTSVGGGGAVSSVSGTTNQVTSTPTTGAVVVSLPSTIIAPGTVEATGSFISNTGSSSYTSTAGTALQLKSGAPLTATSTGSTLSISSGDGGATSGGGGFLQITAGSGITAGQGGNISISAGGGGFTSGGGGLVDIFAGTAQNSGPGGNMQLSAGGAAGTDQAGGTITIIAGQSTGVNVGGTVEVRGGSGGGTSGVGGSATLTGGNTFSTAATGQAVVQSGNHPSVGNSGNVVIQTGTVTDGNAGTVFITGRNGVGTNRSGGSVTINGGSQTGTGTGGDISLIAGGLLGAGTPGKVNITGGAGTGSTTGGIIAILAGSGGATGTGAGIDVRGGPGGSTSGNGGLAQFTGGTPIDGVGGAAQFQGGPGVGTNRAGGQCLLLAGAGTGTASGGLASVQAGATVSGTGGIAYLTGGSGGTSGTGGDISIASGAGGATSGPAGNVFMVGGTPVNGNGGTINITGSAGVGTNRNGGNVVISAGARTGTGTAGIINLVMATPSTLHINGSAGTAGQALVSGGPSSPPVWATAPAAGAGGATTQIQYNNAGVLNGDADFVWDASTNTMTLGGTDTGIVLNGITTDPAAPAAGTGRLFAKSDAGRILPRWMGPSGLDVFLQPTLAKNNVRMWKGGSGLDNTAIASTVAAQIVGAMAYTSLGGGGVTAPALATTSLKTQTARSVITNTNAAGNLAYIRGNALQVTRGNAAGIGGYYVVIRFGLSAIGTNNRSFAGLQDTAANPTNVDPTTNTTPGKIGMAINVNTGNWNLIHNVTGTAPTIIALGANFPVNTTHLWELTLFCAANASGVGYRVANLSTGNVTSGTISTNQPANTTFLTPSVWITNNATAGVLGIDFVSAYVETDY